MTSAVDLQIIIFASSELYCIVSEVCIYMAQWYVWTEDMEKHFSDLEYLQNQDIVESYFLFWDWRRFVSCKFN